MSQKKTRNRGSNQGGSQNRSPSQTHHTEVEELFTSFYDSRKLQASQQLDIFTQVPNDSTAGTGDRQSSRGKPKDRMKMKSQQKECPGADYDNHSPEKPAKNIEQTLSAKVERNVQGRQSEMQTVCPRCAAHFNSTNVPMFLKCKHRICADCFETMKESREPRCPCCDRKIDYHDTDVDSALQDYSKEKVRKASGGRHHDITVDQHRGRSRTPSADSYVDSSFGQQSRRGRTLSADIAMDYFHDEQSERGTTSPTDKCPKCHKYFKNTTDQVLLKCKHTICASCFDFLKESRETKTPCCDRKIDYRDVIVTPQEHIRERVRKESGVRHHDVIHLELQRGRSRTPSADASMDLSYDERSRRGSTTPEEASMDYSRKQQSGRSKTPPAYTTMDYSPISPARASHDGRCIDFSKIPTYHCVTCQQWVCDSCKALDHQGEECHLVPKKDALKEMKQAQVKGAIEAVEGVRNALVKLHSYNAHLNAIISMIEVGYHYIEKEKEHVQVMIKDGKRREREIQTNLHEMQNNKNLLDAVAALQQLEKITVSSDRWTSTVESKKSMEESIARALKEISFCTLKIMKNEAHENQVDQVILAEHNIATQTLYSIIKVEGKRLCVPCLDERETVPRGIAVIPFLSLKSTMDPWALAYLDIGTARGKFLGRVYIRVMSDTTRGRQFLMMCTGETGPSYRHTRFHRIWWKNKPAENIWSGDYEMGDGSGGTSILNLSAQERSSLPDGKREPIRAGLVAGSFENIETLPSTIFRIYTEADWTPRREHSYSTEIAEAYEDAAFGKVIDGLDVLSYATKKYFITDLNIISCGIIIELHNRNFRPELVEQSL